MGQEAKVPQPVTVTDFYLAAILAELRAIREVLEKRVADSPQPAGENAPFDVTTNSDSSRVMALVEQNRATARGKRK